MTQLALIDPPRPLPHDPPPDHRRARARARLFAEARRLLPWPDDVVRDVVAGGVLAESLDAWPNPTSDVRRLAERAHLVEDRA